MIDLATLDTKAAANEGADITLTNPITGEDTDITIRVLGRDSDAFKRVESEQLKRRLEKTRKAKKFSPMSAEEAEEDGFDLLAACTTAWTNVALDGGPLPFSAANALMVYKRFPWIKEQVDQAIGDRAVFTMPQSAASSNTQDTTSSST